MAEDRKLDEEFYKAYLQACLRNGDRDTAYGYATSGGNNVRLRKLPPEIESRVRGSVYALMPRGWVLLIARRYLTCPSDGTNIYWLAIHRTSLSTDANAYESKCRDLASIALSWLAFRNAIRIWHGIFRIIPVLIAVSLLIAHSAWNISLALAIPAL